MSRNILVTGGAGYIGSHTCKALHAAGYIPVTLDNLVSGHKWAVQWGPFVRADLKDRETLRQCFEQFMPEAVIHFAAFAYVGESVSDPARYYDNNVANTLSLLEVMRTQGCKKIVFSSTCAVYGIPNVLPLTEYHPCGPINPYGHSKHFIEQVLTDYGTAYGLRHVALRYFNAAGADPNGDLGEAHDPETHLIPLALKTCQPGTRPLTVFGIDWNTPDGTCIRDYIHVTDLAAAHLSAMGYLETNKNGRFNLGNGNGYSVLEIINAIGEVTGQKVRWQAGPRRAGDPSRLVADAGLAKREIGWNPRYPDLTDIIRHAWQWMAKYEGFLA